MPRCLRILVSACEPLPQLSVVATGEDSNKVRRICFTERLYCRREIKGWLRNMQPASFYFESTMQGFTPSGPAPPTRPRTAPLNRRWMWNSMTGYGLIRSVPKNQKKLLLVYNDILSSVTTRAVNAKVWLCLVRSSYVILSCVFCVCLCERYVAAMLHEWAVELPSLLKLFEANFKQTNKEWLTTSPLLCLGFADGQEVVFKVPSDKRPWCVEEYP